MRTKLAAPAAAALTACGLLLGTTTAAANPARHTDCRRLAMHVTASGRESLSEWLARNQQTFERVLSYTYMCNGTLPRWFGAYVNKQDNKLKMRKGTHFWAQWPQ